MDDSRSKLLIIKLDIILDITSDKNIAKILIRKEGGKMFLSRETFLALTNFVEEEGKCKVLRYSHKERGISRNKFMG